MTAVIVNSPEIGIPLTGLFILIFGFGLVRTVYARRRMRHWLTEPDDFWKKIGWLTLFLIVGVVVMLIYLRGAGEF